MENKDKLCKICEKNKRGYPSVQTCSKCRKEKNLEEDSARTIRSREISKRKYQSLTAKQKKEKLDKYKVYQRIYHNQRYADDEEFRKKKLLVMKKCRKIN